MNQAEIGWIIAFTAGFVSFFSACVLSLIPGYISFISGVSISDLPKVSPRHLIKVLLPSILFVLGFTLIFTLLGASASFIGSFLAQNKGVLRKISGVQIIILGLFLLGVIRIPKLYQEKRFQLSSYSIGYLGAFPLGMAFAFAWTPCIGPILASILLYAGTSKTVTEGALLLLIYSLGLGIPFIITGLAFSYSLTAFDWVKRRYRLINAISAGLLIIMGIMLLTNWWNFFSGWINQLFS